MCKVSEGNVLIVSQKWESGLSMLVRVQAFIYSKRSSRSRVLLTKSKISELLLRPYNVAWVIAEWIGDVTERFKLVTCRWPEIVSNLAR